MQSEISPHEDFYSSGLRELNHMARLCNLPPRITLEAVNYEEVSPKINKHLLFDEKGVINRIQNLELKALVVKSYGQRTKFDFMHYLKGHVNTVYSPRDLMVMTMLEIWHYDSYFPWAFLTSFYKSSKETLSWCHEIYSEYTG